MVYFHKLTHACHCCLEMGSVYARPHFLLLRWDCRKTEKCRREGVNSVCRGDIRLLSVYCVLLPHPLTAHGALSRFSDSSVTPAGNIRTEQLSQLCSHPESESAATIRTCSERPAATWALSDCEGPACRLLFGTENASSLSLGKSGACFSIWNRWCHYF